MKAFLLSFLTLGSSILALAQKNVTLSINHKLRSVPFAFNQTASNSLSQDFRFTRASYYISGIKVIHDGGQLTSVNKYILAKSDQPVTELLGTFNVTNVEGIALSIGVDASVNNADPSLQPTGSPLALQNPSMHWGWASGYIFAALEGNAGASFGATFQLHGLGNANYFSQTIMSAGIDDGNNNVTVYVDADLSEAVRAIDVASGPIQHGDNLNDLTMLQNFRDYVFTPGSAISSLNQTTAQENITYLPNKSSGLFYLNVSTIDTRTTHYELISVSGCVLLSGMGLPATIDLRSKAPGLYFLRAIQPNGIASVVKLMVE